MNQQLMRRRAFAWAVATVIPATIALLYAGWPKFPDDSVTSGACMSIVIIVVGVVAATISYCRSWLAAKREARDREHALNHVGDEKERLSWWESVTLVLAACTFFACARARRQAPLLELSAGSDNDPPNLDQDVVGTLLFQENRL